MADRTRPVAIPAPVAELVEAWDQRSADRFAAVLAPDALVTVPPLHLELRGRDEAWDGVSRLFGAFGALRYTSRHRYLTPDGVTDEVLLEGLQTREFLGAPPTGHPGAVAARVMMRHDGRMITSLTVWPDVSALREFTGGMAQIDLRAGGPAAPVVAALRATIPSTQAKLSVGQGRQLSEVPLPEDATLLPGAPPIDPSPPGGKEDKDAKGRKDAKGKGGPKAPVPRKARRRRAIAAGALMLALAGVLGAYVVQGVRGAKDPVLTVRPSPTAGPTPTPTPTATPSAAVSPSASPKPSSSPSPSSTYNEKTRTFTFNNTILFERNSTVLRPEARDELDKVVAALVGEKRYGDVVVTGYTDDTGSTGYNERLSLQRAQAVKRYLLSQLTDPRFTVLALGKGEANFATPNTSEANREQNRRVEIRVPERTP